jgi:hypothetical protein
MSGPEFVSVFLHQLNSVDVPYMITGAVASTIYGEPRLTQDIDIVLQLDRSAIGRLIESFPPGRYYVPPVEALVEEAGRSQGGTSTCCTSRPDSGPVVTSRGTTSSAVGDWNTEGPTPSRVR